MIIEIPNENSIVKWKNDDKDEWKVAEISDLIKAYENVPTVEISQEQAIDKLHETGWLYNHDKAISEFVRPQGDLISREALKATIIEPLNVNDACKNDWYEGYYTAKNEDVMTIDNAPTVEIPVARWDAYCEGQKVGYEKALSERPQGEWNYIQAGMCVCPFCGAMPHKEYKNFCAKCGADMTSKATAFDGFGVNGY